MKNVEEKQFAVLGLGRFGKSVVKTLVNLHQNVFACDIDEQVAQEIAQVASHVVTLDLADESTYDHLDLGIFDVVIIGMGTHFEASITAIIYAKEHGVPFIIVKAQSAMQEHIFKKLGADKVVLPEKETGIRLASQLASNKIIDYVELSPHHSIVEFEPLPEWVDKSILELDIRNKYKINIIAIRRGLDTIVTPKAKEKFYHNDILVAIGDKEDIEHITMDIEDY